MGELDTYSLIDFMPMEPEVYFRLFIRLNEIAWPFQIVMLILGAGAVWFAWRGQSRLAGVAAGLGWIVSGAVFHLHLFAELNWAAVYAGWGFIAQGVLMMAAGFAGALGRAVSNHATVPHKAGVVLAVFALVIYPCVAPVAGRSWAGIEVYGLAPDPTALVTLGLLLISQRPSRILMWLLAGLLVLIPLLWCLASGAIWYAMQWYAGLVVPAAALIFLFFFTAKTR